MVVKDIDTDQVWKFTEPDMEEGVTLLRTADLVIGHSIIAYDIPLLERIHGPIDVEKYDTLIVARLMYPDRRNHPFGGNSLKAWGKYLNCHKIEYDLGFEEWNPEMLVYCEQDVEVTCRVFRRQEGFVQSNQRSVDLEHLVSNIIARQVDNGIAFDIEAAHQLEQDLLMEKVTIEDDMSEIFPPIVEERWSEKTGKRLKDNTIHFNPGSRKQIAKRLHDKYNWVPPLTDKGNPKVDSAVLKELRYPEAITLVRYFDVIKMLSQLTDWITRSVYSRDGRIHGSVNTQGTVTGRMTANQPNLQQVSGDKRTRALFGPREGWAQVGIDASGLEARLLANRMAQWDDGAYGMAVLHGDIHTVNQQAAGLATRHEAKTFFYALIYGAGNAKIGKIIHRTAQIGGETKQRFLDEMPAMKKVIEKCKFQVAKKGTITLLDDREVPCRAKHAALNVQIQGDGAIIMKVAQSIFANRIDNQCPDKVAFMATVHDEWQLECDPEWADYIGQLGVASIQEAGKVLGCTVPMDGNYRIGKNWAECH